MIVIQPSNSDDSMMKLLSYQHQLVQMIMIEQANTKRTQTNNSLHNFDASTWSRMHVIYGHGFEPAFVIERTPLCLRLRCSPSVLGFDPSFPPEEHGLPGGAVVH